MIRYGRFDPELSGRPRSARALLAELAGLARVAPPDLTAALEAAHARLASALAAQPPSTEAIRTAMVPAAALRARVVTLARAANDDGGGDDGAGGAAA